MLSENAIDNLVQPLIDRQESINSYTLNTIANRVREIGELSPNDVKKLQILIQMGGDIRLINKELARISDLQVTDIKKLIKDVAQDSYIDAKPLYDYRHKSYIPFNENKSLQKLVTAIGNSTAKTYVNISNSKSIGFLVGDRFSNRNLKFQPLKTTYQRVIDEAIQSVASGAVDYRTAIRRALKQLSDSGVRRLSWESGYTQRLDTAVRRNILDGVRAIQQATEDEIAKQINADAKELSAHVNSAPDHEPIQGHIFKNEEYDKLQNVESFKDIDGEHFDAIERAIGTWNCRHFAYAFVIGVSKPKYTKQQLHEFIRQNHEGYTMPNGQHLTMYECTQMQRKLETKIRYAKEEQMMWANAGDKEKAIRSRQRVQQLINEYKVFSNNCGLKLSMDRTQISGYVPNKYS